MLEEKKMNTIGRAEKVTFPTLGADNVPAKIDTGADASSLWCSQANVVDDVLECVFFGPESPFYDGRVHRFQEANFSVTRISSSFGHRQMRYKIKIPMKIKGRLINATFTLADRSNKLYPILIGCSTLRGKFLVDVSRGTPLRSEEKERRAKMQEELNGIESEQE